MQLADLCETPKRHKDNTTVFDIKNDILEEPNDKIKLFMSTMILCDKLRSPLYDLELCETI